MLRLVLLLIATLIAVALFLLLRDSAEGPSEAARSVEVLIPYESFGPATIVRPERGTLGQYMGRLTAYMKGKACGSVDLATASSDAVLVAGGPGYPESCASEGATLAFAFGDCVELFQKLTVGTEDRLTLINMGPMPISDGADQRPRSSICKPS